MNYDFLSQLDICILDNKSWGQLCLNLTQQKTNTVTPGQVLLQETWRPPLCATYSSVFTKSTSTTETNI